jgi:hypothetical protein
VTGPFPHSLALRGGGALPLPTPYVCAEAATLKSITATAVKQSNLLHEVTPTLGDLGALRQYPASVIGFRTTELIEMPEHERCVAFRLHRKSQISAGETAVLSLRLVRLASGRGVPSG